MARRLKMIKFKTMREEYDLNDGERGKFYGKVDTENVDIENDDEPLDETK